MSNIESGATLFTHEEIELYKSTPYYPIIQKLYDLMLNPNPAYTETINVFAERIASIDAEISRGARYKGISFLKDKGLYKCEKILNGKLHYIKKSKSYEVVEQALIEFCSKHNLDPFVKSDRKNLRIR